MLAGYDWYHWRNLPHFGVSDPRKTDPALVTIRPDPGSFGADDQMFRRILVHHSHQSIVIAKNTTIRLYFNALRAISLVEAVLIGKRFLFSPLSPAEDP
jgi:hypothetical protein